MFKKVTEFIDSHGTDSLAHYGVKGMKWGVIRDQANSGDKKAQKKLAKADQKWEKELNSTTGFININNAMARKMNAEGGPLEKLNNDPKFKGKDLNEPGKLQDDYHNAFEKEYRKAFESSVTELYGESPSGKYTTGFDWDAGEITINPATPDKAKHGLEDGKLVFKVRKDPNGHVVGIVEVTDEGDAIKHYGVKGMKWGRRKNASDDSKRLKETRTKSSSELSNKELQDAVNRMNLEKQYSSLSGGRAISSIQTGVSAVNAVLSVAQTVNKAYEFANSPFGKVIRENIKSFRKMA